MRLVFFLFLFFLLPVGVVHAQFITTDMSPVIVEGDAVSADVSVQENVDGAETLSVTVDEAESSAPSVPFDPYTVTNIAVDVTAETASDARDQALVQAERLAYGQLCARFGAVREMEMLTDDDLAGFVQSFEVQSERLSAVRYIGVFTIHFNPDAVKERFSLPYERSVSVTPEILGDVVINVQAQTLPEWLQIKKRLTDVPVVARIDTRRVQRGNVMINVAYRSGFGALCDALGEAGFVLEQTQNGALILSDRQQIFP